MFRFLTAAEQNTPLYNVGIRLVCSADDSVKGTVTTTETKSASAAGVKKALIVYYSWGGNTRGVAKEIARQTGFDSIELELVTPYSTNYNTVLNEAQRDQHRQARPALKAEGSVSFLEVPFYVFETPDRLVDRYARFMI